KFIKEKELKINELNEELENLKSNTHIKIKDESFDLLAKDQLRSNLITFSLNVNEKIELYNAAVNGNINEFKNLVLLKRYPILEEVSAHNYFWTSLHYAMHYGHSEIIYFILEYLK